MTCRRILEPIPFITLLCASTVAGAQSYQPVSDGLLERIQLSPENAAAVTAMCDERLAAGAKLRAELEAMPVTAEPNLLQNVHGDVEVRKASA